MFGNLLSSDLVTEFVKSGIITFEPFVREEGSLAHFPLFPSQIVFSTEHGKRVHDFKENGNSIEIPKLTYGKVHISATIRLKKGLVGVFTPASNLIENGYILTTGKLDPGYKGPIVFGIFNANNKSSILSSKIHIAHVSFYDLRAVSKYKEIKLYLDKISRIREDKTSDLERIEDLDKDDLLKGYDFSVYMGE